MTRDLASRSKAWWGMVLVESLLIAEVTLGAMLCYGPTYDQAKNALGTFETILYLLFGWVCTRWSVSNEKNKEEYLWRYVRLAMPIHFLIAGVCGDVRDLMGVTTLVSVGYMVGFTLQQCYIASVVGQRATEDSSDARASSWWEVVLWHLETSCIKKRLHILGRSAPPRRMSPFKDLKSSLVNSYRTHSDDFKRQPKRGFVFTNLDEMYKNMDLWHDSTALCTAYHLVVPTAALCTALTSSCLPPPRSLHRRQASSMLLTSLLFGLISSVFLAFSPAWSVCLACSPVCLSAKPRGFLASLCSCT